MSKWNWILFLFQLLHHFNEVLVVVTGLLIIFFRIVGVGTRLADNFVVDGDQSGAALAVAEEATSPVDSIASIGVAAVDVPVM